MNFREATHEIPGYVGNKFDYQTIRTRKYQVLRFTDLQDKVGLLQSAMPTQFSRNILTGIKDLYQA